MPCKPDAEINHMTINQYVHVQKGNEEVVWR